MITSQWKNFAHLLPMFVTACSYWIRISLPMEPQAEPIRSQSQFIAPHVLEPQSRRCQGAEPCRATQGEPARRARAEVQRGGLRRPPRRGPIENNSRFL